MKHLKYYFGLITALLLAACSNNEVEVNPHAGEVIEIDARVNNYTPILTKAIDNGELQNSSFCDGSKIRLFVDLDLVNRVVMTYSSSTGKFSYDASPLTFPPLSDVTLRAYYPESDCKGHTEYFDMDVFNVAKDQSTESNYRRSDLMWAVTENVSSNPVTLNFKHVLSKVIVKLNGFSNSTLTINMKELYTRAKVDPLGSEFKFFSLGEKSDIKVTTSFNTSAPLMACVVIPQTVEAGTALIEVTNGTKTLTYNAPSEGIEFKSGHVYTFNLTYSGDRILDGTETVTVSDWNSDDGGGVTHVYGGNLN